MKIIGLSESTNNDFVDYVASFFGSNKQELIMLEHSAMGISIRESGNACNTDELKGIIKDANLIIIARNENEINATDLEGQLFGRFNELNETKVVLYFDISELAAPNLNNSVLELGSKRIPSFIVPNYRETFSKVEGIVDTGLYLKFIRIINGLKSNELAAYFPKERFTCGIDPTRKFFGEEDGY